MTPLRLAVVAVIARGLGCRESIDLTEVRDAHQPPKRGYVVLLQETLDAETVFVVLVPDGRKTPEAVLLAIAKEIHRTRGERHRTNVGFRDQNEWRPEPRLGLATHYARSFAIAMIEPRVNRAELKFGQLN